MTQYYSFGKKMSPEDAKAAFGHLDMEAEKKKIDQLWRQNVMADKLKQIQLACMRMCKGEIQYPFKIAPWLLEGKREICFADCVNINTEGGPYLSEMGEIPEGAVPVKFIWGNTQLYERETIMRPYLPEVPIRGLKVLRLPPGAKPPSEDGEEEEEEEDEDDEEPEEIDIGFGRGAELLEAKDEDEDDDE